MDIADDIEVEYATFPGWLTSTSEYRNFDSLPTNAKCYVQFIEEYLEVPGSRRAILIRVSKLNFSPS
jgi:adenylosuccinate synthase